MYRWDIERINTQLLECEKKIREEKNNEVLIELGRIIGSLEQIIDYYENIHNPQIKTISRHKKPSIKRTAFSDLSILKKYQSYYPYFEQMLASLDSLVIIPKQEIPYIKTTPNHIITVTNDFYNQFKGEITDTFSKIYSTLPTHLEFRRLVGTDVSFAQTLSIYKTGESFYDIGLVNNAQDYITVFHELGHGIANYLNPNSMYDYNKYCFIETDTLFWELVGYDYLSKNLSLPVDSYLISLLYLKEYSYDADIICTKKELYSQLPISKLSNQRFAIHYLRSNYKCDNEYINDVLFSELKESYHYGISYLTAIELYLIYRTDPKIALDLLNKIIKAHDLSNEGYLKYVKSLGIIPGQHIKEYVDILIQRGKELGYGKRLYYQH